MVGALINGVPSVAVGVRGSVRDHEEEFEPLPGYDAGYSDTDNNVGIAFSDVPESWPVLWPRETDPTGTFESMHAQPVVRSLPVGIDNAEIAAYSLPASGRKPSSSGHNFRSTTTLPSATTSRFRRFTSKPGS